MRFSWILLLFICFQSLGQTQKDRSTLETEKKQNLERIEQVKKILSQTSKERGASLSEARAIHQQIKNQERKISLAQEDLNLIQREIIQNQNDQKRTRSELSELQKEYSEIIVREAKNSRKLSKLGFLFSAGSVTEVFMRFKYLKQYSDSRKNKFEKMKSLVEELRQKEQELVQNKLRQTQVVQQVSEDKQGLEELKSKQDQVVKELTSKEGQLKKELEKEQAALRTLNSTIAAVIAREQAARKAAEEAARREAARKEEERKRELAGIEAERLKKQNETAPKGEITKAETTPAPPPAPAPKPETATAMPMEAATIATGKFSGVQKKLSWPTDGFISGRFGPGNHPVIKGVRTDNHGVDIRTSPGADVKSVFEGVVLDISEIPGLNKVVAIQHGDYYTVYANLATVSVKVNQKVNGKEKIGTVALKDGVPEINFQIWRNFTKLNPELWLVSK